jgi:predicted small secreted protein
MDAETSEEDTMKKTMLLLIAAATVTLAACNTVKGVGRDIESVGSAADRAM